MAEKSREIHRHCQEVHCLGKSTRPALAAVPGTVEKDRQRLHLLQFTIQNLSMPGGRGGI